MSLEHVVELLGNGFLGIDSSSRQLRDWIKNPFYFLNSEVRVLTTSIIGNT